MPHLHLTSGREFIFTNLETGSIIGRSPKEDKSTNPKPLFSLSDTPAQPTTLALVQKKDHPHYLIKAGNVSTGVVQGTVKAVVDKNAPGGPFAAESWLVKAQPGHGDDVFTIETSDGSAGWFVDIHSPQDEGFPIIVQPLNPDEPEGIPIYPAEALFIFEEVSNGD